MGRKKELIYYKGNLKGKYLNDKDCEILDNLIDLSKSGGCVTDLKNVIYSLTSDEVEQVIETRSSEFIDKQVGQLRDYQTLGVAFMYFAQRAVLGDSVGLGKTVQICGLCNLITQKRMKEGFNFRYLYLTEKTLLNQTRQEMVKFTGEYVDVLLGEKKYVQKFAEDNDPELLYSVVGAHSLINSVEFQEYLRMYRALYGVNPFDAVFIDESAIVGNTATKTYDNAKKLLSDVGWVVVMNATSFETNLRTFYAQMNLCDDSLLPVKTVFEKLYEEKSYYGPYPKFNGKYKNANIFKSQVRYRYWATTRKGLGFEMKDCHAEVLVSPLSEVQRDLLKKTSMPQMVYDCPSYFDGSIEMDRENTPKIGDLLDLLSGKLRNEGSIIVYSRYIESQVGIARALDDNGVSCEIMNGENSLDEKKAIVSKFKLGDFRVLITNVQKGLNFGHCNTCIFYSYDPNPNKMVQLEGRMTRSENIVGKNTYLLISKGKELSRFKSVVADRAVASDMFTGSDYSCVLSLLLDGDKLKNLD